MESAPQSFPFPSSFQFRDVEERGLEALFRRTLLGVPYEPAARDSLGRTLARLPVVPKEARAEARAGQPAPVVAAEAEEKVVGGGNFKGDAARYVVLYRGENGIGKTRIFKTLRETARRANVPVYEIFDYDVEGIPFKPFLLVLREILRDHEMGPALKEKYRYVLEEQLPDLYEKEAEVADVSLDGVSSAKRGPGVRTRAPCEAEKARVLDGIAQLLLELTSRKSILLLLHDLHWSDQPTVELLRYLGRNLALRAAASTASGPRQLVVDGVPVDVSVPGPELDGFDTDEWRALTRRNVSRIDASDFVNPPRTAVDAARLPGGARAIPGRSVSVPPAAPTRVGPRLMLVANYRGFGDSANYLEQAIRSLGDEPFAYHGELRPLAHEETADFLARLTEGVEPDGVPLSLSDEARQAIFTASEGFPSYLQELCRGLYLREGGADGGISLLGDPTALRALLAWNSGSETSRTGGGVDVGAGPARHAILRWRLRSSSAAEVRVARALAVAMRPETAGFLARVLEPGAAGTGPSGGLSADEVEEALRALAGRGIVEPQEASRSLGGEGGEAGFFFRLWDWVAVVKEGLSSDEEARLHDRVGHLRGEGAPSGDLGDEKAYEVFYHLRRGLRPRAALPYGLRAADRLRRCFALQKARGIVTSLIELLDAPEDLPTKLDLLEESARISLDLKDNAAAEESLRRAQAESGPSTAPERKLALVLLEAEAGGAADPTRGIKILGKAPRLLKDENSAQGARYHLITARLRLARQDLKRAINFALKGISICQKLGDAPELGEFYRVLAAAFYRRGEYAYAMDNYQRALDAFEDQGLKDSLAATLDDLGRVHLERGSYFRAARYLYKSLEIRRRNHDVGGLCRSYDQLAQVYLRNGDYLKTIENLNRSLVLKERVGDLSGMSPTLVALGDLYFRLGRYEQALAYFNRQVETSQRLSDTAGLVEAFTQEGRVHFELGDLKQAESFAKQVSILSTEFKLKSQEADGALLQGNLKAQARDWAAAEKHFKFAADVHGKLGHRRREICAYLDLAEMKSARELWDESLKYASKGLLVAEEVKALDLQVRALTLKGHIHRFLKAGNTQKAREFLQKALELSQGLNDAATLFQLYYSLAKVCHSEREYAEASNYYGKAELILRRIGDALTEEHSARYFEDERRRVFAEDVQRLRKEALGRSSASGFEGSRAVPGGGSSKDASTSASESKDLLQRVLRVHSDLSDLRFHDRLLQEGLELTGAERGFLLRVQDRQYYPVAVAGFGKNPGQDPEFASATSLAQDVVRKGRPFLSSLEDEPKADKVDKAERRLSLGSLIHRSILAVPFMTSERIYGGIYVDKPIVVGQFAPREQSILEAFAEHAAVAFHNRREFELAIRDPITGYYTPSYFLQRLHESYRWFNLHGRAFVLVGFYLPALEEGAGAGKEDPAAALVRELGELLPQGAVVCWGAPILCVLLGDMELPLAEDLARRTQQSLVRLLGEDVPMDILPVQGRYPHGSEMYRELRSRLMPAISDARILGELRSLLDDDTSLKEAKKILEKHKIENTLRKTGGNITHAAKELGIHRPQLSNLLKKYALKREVFENETEDGAIVEESSATLEEEDT